MTSPGGPQRPAPPSGSPGTPNAPQGWSGGARRPGREDDDDAVALAPHEQTLLDSTVMVVGRRGRGPVVVTALVVGAFLLGLLRPWDLVVPPDAGRPVRSPASNGPGGSTVAVGPDGSPLPTPVLAPERALTCAYPLTWRTATIESWTGRQARVWKASDVVSAASPLDPAIPFEPIVAATVTAIGWCAPVQGPDRPPLALTATLYRIADGLATVVPHDRLEPAEPDALGELWIPKALGVGNRPTWPMGRYVIELRSVSGAYLRYLGLELTDHVVRPGPSPAPSAPTPAGSLAPTGSGAAPG